MKRTVLPIMAFALCLLQLKAQTSIPATGFVFENFNGMATGNILPANWQISGAGGGATATWNGGGNSNGIPFVASSGSPTTGGAYNWGTTAGTDRAVGFMTDNIYTSPNAILAWYQNNSGATITSLTLTFQVERYRINTSAFFLTFWDSPNGSTWTARTDGDISAAVFQPGGSTYTFGTPQTVYKSVTISGLSIASGGSYYLRWVFNNVGNTNSQGLGLDNVSLNVNTDNPVVSATLADGVSTPVKQGDPLTYTATISNNGKDATGVQYNAPLDPNTTLNGAVKSSALCIDDNYPTSLNTQLTGQNVLTNDFGLPSKSVLSFGPTETPALTNAGVSGSSDNGGTVVVNSNGTFTYTPPTGFVGYDRFAYTVHAGVAPDDVGIVTIAVGAMPSAGTAESFPNVIGNVPVTNAPGLLSNDAGNGLSIAAVNGNAVASFPATITTTKNGTLTLNANGSFTYNPPRGYESSVDGGNDQFSYTIDNGFSSPQTITVNLTIGGMIWFIDNTAASGGDGRFLTPYNSIVNFANANIGTGSNPASGDNIFIYSGSGSYNLGAGKTLLLLTSQKLVGAAASASLASITGLTVPSYSAALPSTGGTAPVITNTGAPMVTIVNGTTVRGIATSGGTNGITGSALTVGVTVMENNISGGSTEGILLAGNGSTAITNNTISSTGNGIRVTTLGTLSLNVSNNSVTSSANGISMQGNAGGGFTITGFSSNVISGNTVGTGIDLTNVRFDAVAGGGYDPVSGGSTVIGASGNGVGGSGIVLTNVTGDISFTDLDIYNDNGTGLNVTGTGAVNTGAGIGTRLVVASGVSSIEATGGPAVSISNASVNLPLLSLKSTNSPTNGISLVSAFGGVGNTVLSAPSGSSIGGASGTAFNVDGGNGNISYAGTVTNSSGRAVSVTNRTSGTIDFTGSINETGTGILLNNNTGATMNFSGGLTLSTGANAGFTATGGGTVNVTGSNNTITTTTGTALNVASTTIGASNLNFKSVASNGATNGIVLNNTGSSGGLTVTGTGSAGSGGIINTSTNAGISLTSTRSISLSFMNVTGGGDDGITGSSVTNLTLASCNITNNGNAVQERGLEIVNLLGTCSVTNSTFSGNAEDNFYVVNNSGTLTSLSITGSTFSNTSTSVGNDGIHFRGEVGNPNMTISVSNCTFNHNRGDHIQIATDASNTATINATIQNNTFTGDRGTTYGGTDLGGGITINTGGNSNTTYNISNNGTALSPWTGAVVSAITINSSQNANLNGTISNNFIGSSGTMDSGSSQGDGINVAGNATSDIRVTITNNTIRQYSNLAGINIHVRDNLGASGGGTLHATITGNTIANPGTFASNGILAQAGAVTGDDHFLCVDIGGAGVLANSLTGSGANGGTDFRVRQRILTTVRLPGYGGANNDNAAIVSFIQGRNVAGASGSATNNVAGSGGGFVGGGACLQ